MNINAIKASLAAAIGTAVVGTAAESATKTRSKDNPDLAKEAAVAGAIAVAGVAIAHKMRAHYGVDRNESLIHTLFEKTQKN